ncbi:intraflagellar transport protein 25 homolog isoform X2 [Pseudophryne corroboree]|uniref:intraflagellar transport protein 25 homolog isoform X2 n=1 Tax=Pseudophryne corroboree TaxID=495146 RepID=UPI00308171B7
MTRAGNLCLSSAGAVVALATSSDDRHRAQHIIDGNPETFWTTTGMFPQEFIISMSSLQKIGKITMESSLNLEHMEGQFQNEEITLPGVQAVHLRFVIQSAYDHFVAVRSVLAESVM